jgi:CRP-like cAMP-binding protein
LKSGKYSIAYFEYNFLVQGLMEAGEYIKKIIKNEGEWVRYAQGETIFTCDTMPEYLFYILEGDILLIESAISGFQNGFNVSFDHVLGLTEFITGSFYRTTALSESDSSLLRMDKKAFETLFRDDIQFRIQIVKKVTEGFVKQDKVFE